MPNGEALQVKGHVNLEQGQPKLQFYKPESHSFWEDELLSCADRSRSFSSRPRGAQKNNFRASSLTLQAMFFLF